MQDALTEFQLTRYFFALVLLLFMANLLGYIFVRMKMPRVVGEITGGLLLGPTLFGHFFPEAHTWIFSAFAEEGLLLSLTYWFGLLFLMFVSGFEIENKIEKSDKKLIVWLTLGSSILPFVAGWMAPHVYDFTPFIGSKNHVLALQIIIAIATAVTSIPVISKIFIDLDIMSTRFAKVVLSTATIHDIFLWSALAIATGIVSETAASMSDVYYHVGITIAFFGVILLMMPHVIRVLNHSRWNILLKSSAGGYALIICFLFSAVASLLGVNIVFGALLAGIVIGSLNAPEIKENRKYIKEVSLAFFTPLYFSIVGFKLDLIENLDIPFLVFLLAFTTIFQLIGTLITARLMHIDWLSSSNLGVAMITKGGPGIVLATVAYEFGIINETFFVSLVLVAIITSLFAGVWFRMILSKGLPLLSDSGKPS